MPFQRAARRAPDYTNEILVQDADGEAKNQTFILKYIPFHRRFYVYHERRYSSTDRQRPCEQRARSADGGVP